MSDGNNLYFSAKRSMTRHELKAILDIAYSRIGVYSQFPDPEIYFIQNLLGEDIRKLRLYETVPGSRRWNVADMRIWNKTDGNHTAIYITNKGRKKKRQTTIVTPFRRSDVVGRPIDTTNNVRRIEFSHLYLDPVKDFFSMEELNFDWMLLVESEKYRKMLVSDS